MASKPSAPDPAGLFAHDLGMSPGGVAGTDEAGRGCLAGPIVAAAVLFDRECLESFGSGRLATLNDSKRMTARARERLLPEILRCASRVTIVMRSARYIDAAGLQVSNIECLAEALNGLGEIEGVTRLVDGFRLPESNPDHHKLIKGDSKSAAVAAASVVAKVSRDRCMVRAGERYPEYGFEGHKGYASEAHREAIVRHGPSLIHRMSFNSASYGRD
ncbi:MAG: ribonuclease HII [Solirubrobacterales bacterium]